MNDKIVKQSNIAIPEGYAMEIDKSDVRIPSIVLWQKISDMSEFEGENVKAGDFVNPVTGEIYGNNFECVVVSYYTTARIFGDAGDSGRREVLKFSRDAKHWEDGSLIQSSEFAWTDDGSHAVKSYHYLILVKGSNMPAMITFKGASAKFAKNLNANLMYIRPSWRSYFKIASALEEKGGNKYHVIQAKAQPKATTSDEDISTATQLWESSRDFVSSPEMEKDNEFGKDMKDKPKPSKKGMEEIFND